MLQRLLVVEDLLGPSTLSAPRWSAPSRGGGPLTSSVPPSAGTAVVTTNPFTTSFYSGRAPPPDVSFERSRMQLQACGAQFLTGRAAGPLRSKASGPTAFAEEKPASAGIGSAAAADQASAGTPNWDLSALEEADKKSQGQHHEKGGGAQHGEHAHGGGGGKHGGEQGAGAAPPHKQKGAADVTPWVVGGAVLAAVVAVNVGVRWGCCDNNPQFHTIQHHIVWAWVMGRVVYADFCGEKSNDTYYVQQSDVKNEEVFT